MKCLEDFVLFIKEYGEIQHLSHSESCQTLQGGPNWLQAEAANGHIATKAETQ